MQKSRKLGGVSQPEAEENNPRKEIFNEVKGGGQSFNEAKVFMKT